ncbi:serine/threonine protein phosphatase [Mycobacterium sp. KBS0706]|uniref:metallophosphoesterase n=1 Tax=Mycobacterium sp. KBS0706 TaxID=2578109 RepID=UPI00110F8587|nr:metallophosphoesterase [Mycobacterium sp. KBS0706]TSD90332.1 serine/threonine protein phosphatase [Mycobacterium sp. KBS0706]
MKPEDLDRLPRHLDPRRDPWRPAIRPLPPGRAVAAIGDVHGQADLLEAMHRLVAAEFATLPAGTGCTLIHLGDLVDRGPENLRALALARQGAAGAETITLLGNHDDRMVALLDGATDHATLQFWLTYGGERVLAECGVTDLDGDWRGRVRAAIGSELLGWLRGCPVTHRIGDLVFVHAGIDPQRPLAQQDRRALLWIRDPFLDWPGPFPEGVAVIHGHTPADRLDLDHPHRIDVDTGAFATGCLSAVLIHGDRMRGLRVWRP